MSFPRHLRKKRPKPRPNSRPGRLDLTSVKLRSSALGRCQSGRHLLIRVGANVRLLKNLGYVKEKNGLVYLWPDREAARNQPPLVLRLVVARGGKHPVYLVTSVLDEATLSDKQVVEIYALRWGVELFYRHFKQTFERRKLRSDSADNAELEATWSLLGLWAMSLH